MLERGSLFVSLVGVEDESTMGYDQRNIILNFEDDNDLVDGNESVGEENME